MIRQFIFVCFAFLIITASCGQQNTDTYTTGTYTVETIDGVKHVHNHAPLWGEESRSAGLELEFVQKIGAFEATDENYIMYNISDVGRDNDGNIYILDSGDSRIQKFNSQGEYMTTIGRLGEGSSEFIRPVNLNFDHEGRMYIGDAGKDRFIVLNNEGKEIRRFNIDRNRIFGISSRCRFLTRNRMIMGLAGSAVLYKRDYDESNYFIFHVFDIDGKISYSFGKPVIFKEEDVDWMMVFFDTPFCVNEKGNMFIAYRYKNRIEKRDSDGNIIFAFNRPTSFKESKFHRENRDLKFANTFSVGIDVDIKERLWVITLFKQPDEWSKDWIDKIKTANKSFAMFEIFNSDGILLGSIPLPEEIFLMRIFDDRLFIVDTDRVSVSEYKIVEK